MADSFATLWQLVQDHILPFSGRALLALAIFWFGRALARLVVSTTAQFLERNAVDVSLRKFLGDLLYALLLVAIAIAALDVLGVEMTAVVAVLGAASLAVGLALQGSLSNFAAGVMLILLRPYRVGDQVVLGKYVGRVEAIKVFNTILATADNREITLPNGPILAAPIENLTALGSRRLELVVSVAHGSDLFRVRERLREVVGTDDRVLATPAPAIDLGEVTETMVRLYVRPWTSVATPTAVCAELIERIRIALEAEGVKFAVAAPAAA